MARVLITQPVYREAVDRLRSDGHVVVERSGPPLGADDLAAAAEGCEAIVCMLTDDVGEAVFARNPQLRVVSNVAAGVDNVDLDAAASAGVAVTNTPDAVTEATADLTMGLILATARRITEGDHHLRSGRFAGWRLMQHPMGLDVTGARLGIIGLGRIGSAVARRAHLGFGMSVSAVRRPGRRPSDESVPVQPLDLEALLAQSDIVSLHCPLTSATRHLIDAGALSTMPAHSLLINTARGPLVDEPALGRALRDGTIAGAGLDVYEREPSVDPLLASQSERVVLLPHVGSATEGTRRSMCLAAVEHVRGRLS